MQLEMAKLSKKILTGISCLIGLGLFLFTIYTTDFTVVENSKTTTVEDIGRGLLSYDAGGFILPFEVISILLLAAMIGAIIIGKGDKLTKNEDTL
jgi:NADH-quinone oxidoreductase subunit J